MKNSSITIYSKIIIVAYNMNASYSLSSNENMTRKTEGLIVVAASDVFVKNREIEDIELY